MVMVALNQPEQPVPAPLPPIAEPSAQPRTAPSNPGSEQMLNRIMRQEGRVVSLTVRGASLEDEVLLVMLGQRILRSNESITGGEIIEGLRLTGRTVNRVDYQLDKMTTAGHVITACSTRLENNRS